MKKFIGTIIFSIILSACSAAVSTPAPTEAPMADSMDTNGMDNMEGMSSGPTEKYAPLVGAYYNGGDLLFIHTEASDAGVAEMLTEMMRGPLVVLVPELANAPDELLANVYVFTNGLEGMGPFGFQPDIFDSVPGDEAYRPLRRVNLVEWVEGSSPRELKSVAELQATEQAGEVTITQPGIVVNMPVLVWPGGSR